MSEKRIQFSNIVQNQLPAYTQTEFPLVSEFLKSYYQGQEYQGGPIDLIQNIDQYTKLDDMTNLVDHVGLRTDVSFDDETIDVDMVSYPAGTAGFPDSYGLLKIDDEVITYTGITTTAFTGCVRGFCGITSYKSATKPDVLVFNSTTAEDHTAGSKVSNLSIQFLKEFLLKTKNQLLPGLQDRKLYDGLNQNVFVKQAKDFYLSKGTDRSFEILFKALYNEDVKIIRPRDFLFTPSNANYKITNDLVVESLPDGGDPMNLENSTLFHGKYGDIFEKAYAPVTDVKPIKVGAGETYYKLSFDAGYNRDVRVDGSVYGKFLVHPKTKAIGQVAAGATAFSVDSTVGFPQSGELEVLYSDNTIGIVTYTSKSVTQFYGCTDISSTILDGTKVGVSTYAYAVSSADPTDEIKVRINSVLSNLEYPSTTHYYHTNDTAKIKTLGIDDSSFKGKNWFYNIAPTYKVKDVELIDTADYSYKVNLYVDQSCNVGDIVTLISRSGIDYPNSVIINIDSSQSVIIKGQGELPLDNVYTLRRNILTAESNTFPGSSIYATNVQNTYRDGSKFLVASSSIPTYNAQPLNVYDQRVIFTGTFEGEELKIVNSGDHGFYTGDEVYYTPQRVDEKFYDGFGTLQTREVIKSSLFTEDIGPVEQSKRALNEGLYFIKRISPTTVKLSLSRTNISENKFIDIKNPVSVENCILEPHDFKKKTLQSQNLFREIDPPKEDGVVSPTLPGFTGILVNGVEISNYKSLDQVYYGKIKNIELLAPGNNYDVINPPTLQISDNVGSGATAYAAVMGSFNEIRVLESGFDYEDQPSVNISGGNGTGAVAEARTKLIKHSVNFNASSASSDVGLGTVGANASSIGFSTYHKFRNAEKVIYLPHSQTAVGGIGSESAYFARIIDPQRVKLHLSEADAIVGINTVELKSHGFGRQSIESYNKKLVIESVNIISAGVGYENKRRTATASVSGINTSLNRIQIENHGYQSGEIVKYTSSGTAPSGLNSGTEYYVTRMDNDSFKLSTIVTGNKPFNYDTQQFVDITSVGVGTHTFNYQDIKVSIDGKIGISTVGFNTTSKAQFEAKIQPIVRGELTSVHVEKGGSSYGSPDIINFDRQPLITLATGSQAQVQAVVSGGQITEVLVQNTGKDYTSPPNLIVSGTGVGAVVTPVLEDGKITSVNVIESGMGYNLNDTEISVEAPGKGAEFRSIIQSWRINLVERHFNNLTADDGYIPQQFREGLGLQYCHLYAPRKLREAVYGTDQTGKTIYGKPDLQRVNSIETPSTDHSPIIGWAYDGNPIYGPYGYLTPTGGVVTQMKSGYTLKLQSGRPSVSIFPEGFFIEDYSYSKVEDDTILDEKNGRFGITPEFPKGTYAYFAAINNGPVDSSGQFAGYKRPVFPYLIGDSYKSTPNKFNFDDNSNQTQFELADTTWSRNTSPYNLIEEDVEYKYAYIPDNLNQTVDIVSVKDGEIESIGIQTSGDLYRVGDGIEFDNTGTGTIGDHVAGFGADVRVSRVDGKPVSSIDVETSSIENVEIYPSEINSKGNKGEWVVESSSPHNFKQNQLIVISGLSTTSSQLEGAYRAGITTEKFSLVGIGTTNIAVDNIATTGIVTYFYLAGKVDSLKDNDLLTVNDSAANDGKEVLKILNVEPEFSRVRVVRNYTDNNAGSAHTVTAICEVDPRRILVDAGPGFKTSFATTSNASTDPLAKRNKQIYFNPSDTVAIGVNSGFGTSGKFPVGAGYTIFFSNPGAGVTDLFIPVKTVYIKGHNLKTGDKVTYNTGGGTGLGVKNQGGGGSILVDDQTLYVAKVDDNLIGIATVQVGMGTQGTYVGIAQTYRSSTTLEFANVGNGVQHSFKTNYQPITGTISRHLVTVGTAQSTGLVSGNEIDIDVNPSISTSFTVKYSDYNRKIIINPRTFASSGINTITDTITLVDHGFNAGEKVIYNATTPAEGLVDNGTYFIARLDKDNFKLCESYYNATILKPITVGISSISAGTISPINPPLKVYRDSSAIFDVSDPSLSYDNQGTRYSAFEFNFYVDKNYTQKWEKSLNSEVFEVKQTGNIGINTDAKITLTVNKDIPEVLYYRLDPIFESDIPVAKVETVVDTEVVNGSEVQTIISLFNGKHPVTVGVGSTATFTYTLPAYPEKTTYNPAVSSITYNTNSRTAYGPINSFEIKDGGRRYYTLPGISTIASDFGFNAVVSAASTSIGGITKTKIRDIGYNFPSDTTLRPSVGLPQIMKMRSLASIESIGITSVGRGYSVAPKLIVLDGITKKIVPDIDLKYTLGQSQVTILRNTSGISKVIPAIIPTGNSNGVGISTVGFNTITKDVTITLGSGFSTAGSFPFAVNDKVLIENISVGIGSTGKGFNSAEYEYNLFNVDAIDANIGGLGIVTYSLAKELLPGENPGSYDPFNSTAARIINSKHFPMFDVKLTPNNYTIGETVKSDSSTGIVEHWDGRNEILTVSSNKDFTVGEIIEGQSSDAQGIASSITSYNSSFDIGPTSKVENGWETDSGVLNYNLQRLQDNDYYQNFSYSLRSRVSYTEWDDVVSSLNHTLGHKKFSDYQLDSSAERRAVGLTTDLTSFEVVNDIVGYGDLNCFYDFDLVKENSLNVNNEIISDRIIFSSRILTDYEESVGNRVLSIDDMSGSFNSNPRSTRFTVVETFDLSKHRAQKYITYIKDKRFYSERQIMLVDLIHDGTFGYINQYGRVETVYDMGSFDFSILGNDGRLLFYPNKYTINDYEIVALSYNLDDNLLGIGTTSLGPALIESNSVSVPKANPSTTVVGIASTYRSAKILIEITPDSELTTGMQEFEFEELTLVHNGSNVELLEYGEMTTSLNTFNLPGFGTYSAGYSGPNNINIDFWPNAGIGTTAIVNTLLVALGDESTTGTSNLDLKHARLEGRTTTIAASGTPTPKAVGQYPDSYDAAYFTIQVTDTTNDETTVAEMVVLDDYDSTFGTGETYFTNEYGEVATTPNLTLAGLGTFYTGISTNGVIGAGGAVGMAATTQLIFTPLPNIATQVKVFMNALRIQDDDKDIIDFNNASIHVASSEYTGTERAIKRSFPLTHKQYNIFDRSFDGESSSIVGVDANTIELPNHFFVSGEKVNYVHAGAGSTQAIGIAATDGFVGIGTTTKLPGEVFVIKVDENKIKVTDSAAKALLSVPESVDLTSVGIGTSHRFVSTNQNAKALLCLDNIIQSPVVATAITSSLSKQVYTTDDLITMTGITSFFGGDLIRIGQEILKIEGVGIGSTNIVRVRREWLGTSLAGHSTGSLVTKVNGNYNIVENTLNFTEAPFGNLPMSSTTNPPDDRDWTGISTSSNFQGRTFMRSGVENTSNETYYANRVFDDISTEFNGIKKDFDIKSDGSNITGIATENAVILINDVFQGPVINYELNENLGITSIQFTGTASSTTDVNVSTLPVGGVILSVGSTEGTGYQPLVAAGGTALVSVGGTIEAISLGNTGSGYRVGIQTVNVSIQQQSAGPVKIDTIGTASISGGHITGIAVTNWNAFYKPRDIRNVGYSSITGITTITTAFPHDLNAGDDVTLSGIAFTCNYSSAASRDIVGVAYSAAAGIMTVTTATTHGLSVGKDVILTGLGMTCGLTGGISTDVHIYPRNRDRVYDTSIPITKDGTPYTVTNATYNPTTGIMSLTVAGSSFNNGDKIKLKDNSLIFTCAKDNHKTHHSYPRSTDPYSGKWLPISNVSGTSFDVQVLDVIPSTNTTAHTFVSAITNGLIYQDGKITINVTAADPTQVYNHTFVGVGTDAVIAGGNYTHHFVGNATNAVISGGDYGHTFVSASAGGVTIAGLGTTTPTSATYDASTGDMVLTIPAHGASSGTGVTFFTGAITFSCSMDGYATEHAYPRSTDPIVGMGSTAITATTGNTLTINVGTSKTVGHDVTDASYNPATGLLDLTIPNHGLMGQTNHTVSFAIYDPVTGIMTCTVPGHTFSNGDRIKFNDNSLSFRCAHNGADGAAQIKTYPRSTDPKSKVWLPISGVTTSNFEVQVLDTIPSTNTGIHTFVSGVSNGLKKAGVSIKIPDNALTFTCDMDKNSTKHTYPRNTDPFSNTSISIGTTTVNTIQLYVGVSSAKNYTVTAADYNATSGIMTMTIGAHALNTGSAIKLAKESLSFTCDRDGNATIHKYPRAGDPHYDGMKVTKVGTSTEFTVNVGVSTVPTYWNSGGKVQGVIVAPRQVNNSPSGQDPAAGGTTVLEVLNPNTFVINSGLSTTPHFYARGGKVQKSLDVVFDDPMSYTNIPLEYSSASNSGVGTQATIDIVVGAGGSITDFRIENTGSGFGVGEILTIPLGGNTGIPTTSGVTFKEFQLTIDQIFTDEFTGWSVGTLEALDTPQNNFDGDTVAFQLKRAGDIISIRSAKGSKINVEDVLFIFVNDILQVPGKGYTFDGGSIITFTEAPKKGDTCKVIFYKGSGGIDVKERDIIETVKIGDNLKIEYDPGIGQKFWQEEDPRNVTRVDSTDIVSTNPYRGPGNTEDETLVRPVKWCKQTEDMIINELEIGKDRELYEPNVYPSAIIIKSVGIGSTTVCVDSVRPFFDPYNENADANIRATTQDKITLVNQDSISGATASAAITNGAVTSISITNGGSGYASVPNVSLQTPVGLGSTATAIATLTGGAVSGVTVSYGGTGYTSAPQVLIDPPTLVSETNAVLSYNGDSGTVVGFGTTVASNIDKLIFDFYIPEGSYFRNANLVGTAVTMSGIKRGDYFVIDRSNLGFAQTSITSRNIENHIVAIGKSFFDNVYQVDSATSVRSTIPGIGVTDVVRIHTRISGVSTMTFSATNLYFDSTNYTFDNTGSEGGPGSGYVGIFTTSPYFGEFSWGRIELIGRKESNAYPFYGDNGVGVAGTMPTGIHTSAAVQRALPLKAKKYDGQLV